LSAVRYATRSAPAVFGEHRRQAPRLFRPRPASVPPEL
jgi:hypothetical protein